jgi:hypothetical protein
MNPHESVKPETVEWFTPPEVFAALGLEFDLDAASPIAGPVPWVPARRFLTELDDGRTAAWSGRVWCNPPFGRPMLAFAQRMAAHGDGVLLMPARTDTRAFHVAAPAASAVLFTKGRLAFIRADGYSSMAGFASVLLAFGPTCGESLARSGLGLVLYGDGGVDALVSEGTRQQLSLSLDDAEGGVGVAIEVDDDNHAGHGFSSGMVA